MTWLALGTAQFGLAYGVAGRGGAVVEESEVRAILERAAANGVRVLDTAPAYGDIEARLANLTHGLPFSIVSKIGAVPQGTADAAGSVRASVEQSLARLGTRLTTFLFHRAEDLLRPDGDLLWRTATELAGPQAIVGVSVYDPHTIISLRSRYPLPVAQVPGNAFDQRLSSNEVALGVRGIELHVRSVFLQGLLLLPSAKAAHRVPALSAAHTQWVEWCRAQGVPPIAAALSVARALPGASLCVVGVDSDAQLREVLDAAKSVRPLRAASLACHDPAVIDPRLWRTAS